jgi:hypothetical protein
MATTRLVFALLSFNPINTLVPCLLFLRKFASMARCYSDSDDHTYSFLLRYTCNITRTGLCMLWYFVLLGFLFFFQQSWNSASRPDACQLLHSISGILPLSGPKSRSLAVMFRGANREDRSSHGLGRCFSRIHKLISMLSTLSQPKYDRASLIYTGDASHYLSPTQWLRVLL